ncbi:UNKNOWN [Stylonychia lemnae]|uniref:Uncharacterized protein n=1 Tax=Stylonychia lemnae TaxID=5949 RepID=A0A078AAT6_STYLE|nr:UNKNOWN [Stylonychia lemnae]|eukprot:CDW77898.1 UNKNOWN [Stylonychia lemnae]
MKLESIRDLDLISYQVDNKIEARTCNKTYGDDCVVCERALLILGRDSLVKMIFLHASRESQGFIKDLGFTCANIDFHKWKRDSYSLIQLDISSKREPQFEWFQKFKLIYDKVATMTTIMPKEMIVPRNTVAVLKSIAESSMPFITILRNSLIVVAGQGMLKVIQQKVSIILKQFTQSIDANDCLVTQSNGINDQLVTLSNYTYLKDTKHGQHKVLTCSMCIKEKRIYLFVKGVSLQVTEANVQRFTLGKRHASEVESEQLNYSIQSYLEQNGDADIDMQDETSPQQQQQEFDMPSAPFAKRQKQYLVYVVTLTDNLVVVKFKEIEASKKNRMLLLQDLLDICEQFTQDLFLEYISNDKHPALIALLPIILTRPDSLNKQRMICIVMFSFILVGACWNSSVKLLDNMDKDKQSQFLKHIEEQRIMLISYHRDNNSNVDGRLLVLSFAVQLDNQALLAEFTSYYQRYMLHSFQSLVSRRDPNIQEQSVYVIISNRKEEFMMQSLCEQKVLIHKNQVKSVLEDFESIQSLIEELSDKYGEIMEDLLKTDLTMNQDCIFGMAVPHQRNSLTKASAFAQYFVGKLFQVSRQLWVEPLGQGKSRIAATFADIALIRRACTKVNMVFVNNYLLKRYGAAFADFWDLLDYDETCIQYHADCKLVLNMFDYMIEPKFESVKNITDIQMDKSVKLLPSEKKAFIKKFQVSCPVFVNYKIDLGEEINKSFCDYTVVIENIFTTLLENLDKLTFQILIVEGEFGMRGVDYRCKHAKMTIVNKKPFINRARQFKAMVVQVGPTMYCMMKLSKIETKVNVVQVKAMSKGLISREKNLIGIGIKKTKPTVINVATL